MQVLRITALFKSMEFIVQKQNAVTHGLACWTRVQMVIWLNHTRLRIYTLLSLGNAD